MTYIEELKENLNHVKSLGWVKTLRPGNTGVGYTLESLLDIDENNDSSADVHGVIELKAKRKDGSARTTSFCQSPIWFRPPREVVWAHGWQDKEKERLNFYPSLRLNERTPQGLGLAIDGDSLYIHHEGNPLGELPLQVMQFRFRQKFRELVIVLAQRRGRGKSEEFYFDEAYHCTDLSTSKIRELLEEKKIVVEPRMWLDPNTDKLRDRGMAIRLSEKWTKELFGSVQPLL